MKGKKYMVSNNTTSTITAADNTSYNTLSNFFDTITTATTATLSNNCYNWGTTTTGTSYNYD